MEYQPAPGSPAAQGDRGGVGSEGAYDDKDAASDESDDPLDKYMQEVEVSIALITN